MRECINCFELLDYDTPEEIELCNKCLEINKAQDNAGYTESQRELLKSYEFTLSSELLGYVFESYINGQKKQAIEVLEECQRMFNFTFADDLYICLTSMNTINTIRICKKLDIKKVFVENAFYDNDYHGFTEKMYLINEIYSEEI